MSYSVYRVGDSLTAADYYEAELRTLFGASFTLVGKGVNGYTTAGMLERFKTDILDHDPEFVVIWGGASTWTAAKQVSTDNLHDCIMNTAINIGYRVEDYHPLEHGYIDCLLPACNSGDHLHSDSRWCCHRTGNL